MKAKHQEEKTHASYKRKGTRLQNISHPKHVMISVKLMGDPVAYPARGVTGRRNAPVGLTFGARKLALPCHLDAECFSYLRLGDCASVFWVSRSLANIVTRFLQNAKSLHYDVSALVILGLDRWR